MRLKLNEIVASSSRGGKSVRSTVRSTVRSLRGGGGGCNQPNSGLIALTAAIAHVLAYYSYKYTKQVNGLAVAKILSC
jgi:hypothetical protein